MDDFGKIEKLVNLLIKKRQSELSVEDQKIVDSWLEEDEKNKALYKRLTDDSIIPEQMAALSGFNKKKAYQRFITDVQKLKMKRVYLNILKYAAVILPLAFVMWVIINKNNHSTLKIQTAKTEIKAGSSQAILKLADGSIINLEREKDLVVDLDGAVIHNDSTGITYNYSVDKIRQTEIQYNIIEVPRGGEYQLLLSDGTKVWLNSETSIKYPVYFSSSKREVFLQNGEAFFEVTENMEKPFIVHTSKIDVNVLGTSFNVRAYSDEAELTATLVRGKVLLKKMGLQKEYTLTPNKQAVISNTGVDLKNVDVTRFIAWKEGRIIFEDNTLEEIFKDLGRWYNVDVVFENEQAGLFRFSVDVERYDDLKEILEILQLTKKVRFETNKNKIIVK